jgi:hypothetical protein
MQQAAGLHQPLARLTCHAGTAQYLLWSPSPTEYWPMQVDYHTQKYCTGWTCFLSDCTNSRPVKSGRAHATPFIARVFSLKSTVQYSKKNIKNAKMGLKELRQVNYEFGSGKRKGVEKIR